MTVQLSTLRVVPELDPAKFVTGANAIQASQKGMAAGNREVSATAVDVTGKISSAGDVLARLSRQYVEGARASQLLTKDLNALARGVESGKIAMTQADAILTGMAKRYGSLGDGAQFAAKGQHELAAAINATNARLTAQVATANSAAASISRVYMAANENRAGGSFQTANIAAQFQDVGVTAAMGMNPLMIGLQQGMQLSAVLGPMGAAGAVRGLGAAFLSLVNPVSLVTIGLTAATAAAIQWGMSTKDEVDSMAEVLKRHEANIGAIKSTWGDAAGGVEAYVTKSRAVIEAQNIMVGADLAAKLRTATGDAIDGGRLLTRDTSDIERLIAEKQAELSNVVEAAPYLRIEAEIARLNRQLEDTSQGVLTAARDFGVLTPAVDDFAGSVRKGAPDFIKLQDAMSRQLVADPTNQGLRELVKELDAYIATGVDAQSAAEANRTAFDNIGRAAEDNARRVSGFADAMDRLSKIATTPLTDRQTAMSDLVAARNFGGDQITRQAAEKAYRDALTRIDSREAGARVPTPTRRPNDFDREPDPIDRLREEFDFERAQVLRSASEQQIASRLRGTGLGMNSREADFLRQTQQLSDLRDGIRGFVNDFRTSLLNNGGDIGQAFADAVGNAALTALDAVDDEAVAALFAVLETGD